MGMESLGSLSEADMSTPLTFKLALFTGSAAKHNGKALFVPSNANEHGL